VKKLSIPEKMGIQIKLLMLRTAGRYELFAYASIPAVGLMDDHF
jgi:hypothetical protein